MSLGQNCDLLTTTHHISSCLDGLSLQQVAGKGFMGKTDIEIGRNRIYRAKTKLFAGINLTVYSNQRALLLNVADHDLI